jgi:hypothetical protein
MQPWKRAWEADEVEVCADGRDEEGIKSSWLAEEPPINVSDIMIQLFTESALEKS